MGHPLRWGWPVVVLIEIRSGCSLPASSLCLLRLDSILLQSGSELSQLLPWIG